jgi:hypothetical protein
VETGSELEQRRDPAAGRDAAGRRLDDLGHQAKKSRLALAVPANEPDSVTGLDLQRHISQCPHIARARAATGENGVLQRALCLRIDTEAPRDPVDHDLAGLHSALSFALMKSR